VQVATPQEIYDRPADAFVANFVGRANLIEGIAAGADAVDTPLGRLSTLPHGAPDGASVRLLVRPERIEPAAAAGGENVFAAKIVHDRFFGANREIELTVGRGSVKIETAMRGGIAHVRVPREAVQFLPTH
jgi:ABC-type Fe3+/spermidine/putrescine transport system ATPase subunit